MHRRVKFVAMLTATSVVLTFTIAWAQQPNCAPPSQSSNSPPSQTPDRVPSLRTTTRLVQISVLVHDGEGNPVAGLTKENFELRVDKRPQQISVFSAETNLPPAEPAEPLPPNTYSNRRPQHAIPMNLTVILLDELNTDFADKTFARKKVSQFLTEMQPQDHVALYRLTDALRVLRDFNSDPAATRAALDNLRGAPSPQLANAEPDDPSLDNPNASTPAGTSSEREAYRRAFAQREANESSADRVHATIAALLAIANHVGGLPGRKNLVWISTTFPFSLGYDRFDLNWSNDTGVSFGSDVENAARALNNANIAVYPVDARGLIGDSMKATRENEFPVASEQMESFGPPAGEFDTMKILAARTGGRAFYNSNDISGAIRRAIDDSRVTYTLGYYPADVKWDGSFHPIQVKANVPGVHVRSRTGFFALPDPPGTPLLVRGDLSQTLSSQLEATGVGMSVDVQATSAPEQVITANLHLDLHDIQMKQERSRWTGRVQSVFFLLNDRGEVLGKNDRTFRLLFEPAVYERTLRNGLSDSRRLRVGHDASQLCIVVRDTATGKLGSILIPLAKYFSSSSEPAN
jgi:VWFA-related protein